MAVDVEIVFIILS